MALATGNRGLARRLCQAAPRLLAALTLLALLLQILPFTCGDPLAAAGDGRAFSQYIEPLPVCGDDGAPGGLLADRSWLPAPAAQVSAPVLEAGTPPEPPLFLPAPPSRRLLRPPRA